MAALIQSMSQMSEDTLALFAAAAKRGKVGDPRLLKAINTVQGISQAAGLTWYDLQTPAKNLFPVITPLRNKIPRVKGSGDVATHWKAVIGINVNKMRGGVPEGLRSGVVSTKTQDRLQTYKSVGLEDFVNFEAVNAAINFEDVRSTTGQRLLWATMIQEEAIDLGGNSDQGVDLGTTPTPAATPAATNGSIANGDYTLICVALTHGGWMASSMTDGVPDIQHVTSADGDSYDYNPGTAIKSTATPYTITGSSQGTVAGTVTAVKGATAYAWYSGPSGSERLQAITTINSVLLTSLSTTTQLIGSKFTTNASQNAYEWDGIMTHAFKTDSDSIISTLATGTPGTGTKLSVSNNDASIDQIQVVLKAYWDRYKISPNVMYVSAQELQNISALVIKNNGSPIIRLNGDFSQGVANLTAGSVVGSYLNRYAMGGGQLMRLELHPNAAPGTIVFDCETLPYPLSNVTNVKELHYRQDYYQLEWPLRKRRYETGVYCDACLAHYFPAATAILNNISDGI